MDRRFKTKAITGVSIWVASIPLLVLVFVVGGPLIYEHWPDVRIPSELVLIAFLVVQYVSFFWGGKYLAKAKGYSTGILGFGILWPAQLIVLAILLFALPDKNPRRRHHQRQGKHS